MRATRHYVQGYRVLKGRDRKTGRLEPADRLEVLGAAVACGRAERMYATGRYAGVAAVTVTHDRDEGEYGEPVFLLRLGRVPPYEGGMGA